ncbi:MAG: hypothetical protein LBU34_16855 [Planctomycetaceae bacterium]|nr:hypothetical protein [Planctomycetaceae bacterium]
MKQTIGDFGLTIDGIGSTVNWNFYEQLHRMIGFIPEINRFFLKFHL